MPKKSTVDALRSVCVIARGPDDVRTASNVRHVLYCGATPLPRPMLAALEKAGIGLTVLEEFSLPSEFQVRNLYEPSGVDHSDRVRCVVEELHVRHRFDEIEFGLEGGLGLRTMQAKRAGLAFAHVVLAIRVDGCGLWRRDQEQRWSSDYEELETDFAECYSFEHADLIHVPSADRLDFVGRLGWKHVLKTEDVANDRTPLVTIGIAHYNLGRYLTGTLASLAAQTYRDIEVLIVDDGSSDADSLRQFAEMEAQYPQFRFLRQRNAGIGATRNRCLTLASGEYFIPVDADNLAKPEMVARFVRAMNLNPDLAAMTCYFLAFEDGDERPINRLLHACRPPGGPHVLAGIRNVYGDANAIFRTAELRQIGGYEIDRDTSCEDWETFVKLVHAGMRIGIVPDHLFYYRQLQTGFSRRTNPYANHMRVLRQFASPVDLPDGEVALLRTALLGFHQRIEQLKARQKCFRYRIADVIYSVLARAPGLINGIKRVVGLIGKTFNPGSPVDRKPGIRDGGREPRDVPGPWEKPSLVDTQASRSCTTEPIDRVADSSERNL